jgi:MmyB-like transcription regulator ligand binding domain
VKAGRGCEFSRGDELLVGVRGPARMPRRRISSAAGKVNVLRLALHPDGIGRRVRNLAEWGRHIIDSLNAQTLRSSDNRLDDAFIAALKTNLPTSTRGPDPLGFAVPLRLRSDEGELHLTSTLTSNAPATGVALAELHVEAFLPADQTTAAILQRRAAT